MTLYRTMITIATWLFVAPCAFAVNSGDSIEVTITNPRPEDATVGARLIVEGTASLPAGHHLWVFVRRFDFDPFWWPQNEARIDPKTGKWRVSARFGEPRDVGWDFDLAVAVFKGKDHFNLKEYRRDAMLNNDWKPIEMPEAQAPPNFFQLRKMSDR